jgi:PAS domain S-box-containing protein
MSERGAQFDFLSGGGEMGALTRAFDWANTSIGAPKTWPQSLRTTLRILLTSRHPMFIWWGPELIQFYNDAYLRTMGPERHPSALGQRGRDCWAEIWDIIGPQIDFVMAGKGATWQEDQLVPVTRHGGLQQVWWTYGYSPIDAESGVGGVLVVCNDVTEGHETREALRRVNATIEAEREATREANDKLAAESGFLRELFQQAPSFVAVLRGPEHIFELTNAAYIQLVGHRDVVGMTVRDALPEIAGQGFLELLDNVYRTGEPFVGKQIPAVLQVAPNGPTERRLLDFVYQPIKGADGTVRGIFVEGIDFTQSAITQEALHDSESRYRSLFESIDAGFCIVEMKFDAQGRPVDYLFIETNPAFEEQTGLRHPVGKTIRELAPGIETNWFEIYGKVAMTGEQVRFESRSEALDDRWFDVYAFRSGAAEDRRVAVLFNDVSLRKRAEEILRESETQFRTFAQAMPNHVWTSKADGQLDWFNARAYEYSGLLYGDIAWTTIVHPDDLASAGERWVAAVSSGETYEIEFRLRRADGVFRWHIARAVPIRDASGAILRWIGTNTDIEDQKNAAQALSEINATLERRMEERTGQLVLAEEALRQSQKMEAVGQLTGGIAHDFNNLLQGILGALDRVQKKIADGRIGEVDRFLKGATESANRAAALTHRLLAFSRRQPVDPRPVRIGELIGSVEELLRRTIGETIELDVSSADDLWLVRCDHNQLENALLNLAINARDAMPDGGTLSIATSNVVLDATWAQRHDLPPGDFVCLKVRDTGVGMPADVKARAFDPFYTTKPIGQGTGLGLSMIYGFVRQSGGAIRIESDVGQGTTIEILLPRFHGSLADPAAATPPAEPRRAGFDKIVLVVEDEAVVRLLIVEVLNDLGFQSLEAADGPSALRILQSPQRIDLLVSDIGLPGLNGRQLADAARAQRPDLKVLFMTGYAENAAGSAFLEPGMEIVTKPVMMDVLASRILGMIDGKAD